MQDDPSESDSLKQYISELKAENNKIMAENIELKARVAKLEDKLSQNELIKNLLSVSRKTWSCINLAKFQPGHPCQNDLFLLTNNRVLYAYLIGAF